MIAALLVMTIHIYGIVNIKKLTNNIYSGVFYFLVILTLMYLHAGGYLKYHIL